MTNSFDLESTRRDLIAMRLKHGAKSKVGMRCSNVIEQLFEYWKTGRTSMVPLIQEQMADLARLTQGE